MVNQSEHISYLIENPNLGDSLNPLITNSLLNDEVGDFEICAAETYSGSDECVIYIDECSTETAEQIRTALQQTFVVLDEDFHANNYEIPEGAGTQVVNQNPQLEGANIITMQSPLDTYLWN